MKELYIVSLDEEFEKARKLGAKDKKKRKRRGGGNPNISMNRFVGAVEELESKSWKVNERVNDWLDGTKDEKLDALAKKHGVTKKQVEEHVQKEYY